MRFRRVEEQNAGADPKPDGRRNNGGKREGAGRPPGPTVPSKYKILRDLACAYTEEAFETIVTLMRETKDEWLRLACANAILDRGHGKPRWRAVADYRFLIAIKD